MRERRYLTFDMENPRHREALVLFSAQSDRQRSEYVVDCILKAQQENRLEDTMRRVISEALNGISLTAPAMEKKAMIDLQMTESLSDLPDALLSSLDEI
ncbi:MAG: plasmid segregation centromere-binding protein ParR [Bacillota bacterium]|jgi:hypothetical protein